MKKFLKKAVIAHTENNYTPHLFQEIGLVVVFLLTIGLFGATNIARDIVNSDISLSAIYPSVIVALTNEDRAAQSLPELKKSTLLEEAAQAKAQDMLAKGYFAHISPDGTTPWYWIKQTGYSYHYAGENLAINFSDSSDVTDAWMKSPTHRANLLNEKFSEVGVATIKGNVNGREVVFVVQMFGSPKNNVTMPVVAVASTSISVGISTASTTTTTIATTTASSTKIASTSVLALQKISTSSVLGISTTSEDVSQVPKPSFATTFFLFTQPYKILRITLVVLLVLVSVFFVFFLKHAHKIHIRHTYYGLLIIFWLILCAFLAHISASPTVLL